MYSTIRGNVKKIGSNTKNNITKFWVLVQVGSKNTDLVFINLLNEISELNVGDFVSFDCNLSLFNGKVYFYEKDVVGDFLEH